MKAGVIVFPASNCDRDAAVTLAHVTGQSVTMVWHKETALPQLDLVVIPGGFSYGDYLRPGAMAARSPIMRAVVEAAERGVRVLGICNGFQILTEIGLLPGVLMRNAGLTFVSRTVGLTVGTERSPFTRRYARGERLHVPIAHHEGNYLADSETLDRLEEEDRIAFRYTDNPNGSARDIAGILGADRNVLGMMPHPERAADAALGSTDGWRLFAGLVEELQ